MRTVSKNFRLPVDLSNWLESQASETRNQSEIAIDAIRMFSELDQEQLEEISKEIGIIKSKMIEISLYHFLKLDKKERMKLVSKFYEETL